MRPTLKDIALRTGLDVSTVSRVLNRDTSRGVSEQKRREVLEVASQLGYQPHRSARALRTGRHYNVAYVLMDSPRLRSNLELPFARYRLYGIEETLATRGYLLSLLRLDPENPESVRKKAPQWRQVDGVIFNYNAPSPDVMALLREARVPMVVIDADIFAQSQGTVSCVLSDREGGILASVGHLIGLGHRRIALVNASANRERLAGYLRALAEHGIEPDEQLIRCWSDPDSTLSAARSKGYRAVRELLAEGVHFTAVQAGSDYTAAGAIDALREAGLRVPEDVAVAGFDNVDEMGLSPLPEPFLTTVHDPNREMGEKAAELLLAQIEEDAEPQRLVLPTRLVVRRSSGGPRQDS